MVIPKTFHLESIESCLTEDRMRVGILRRQQSAMERSMLVGERSYAHFGDLALKIEKNLGQHIRYRGSASARYFRLLRLRLLRNLHGTMSDFVDGDYKFYTIVPRKGWKVQGNELIKINPKHLLERFRQQLNRNGLIGCKGALIARLHGEFDPTTDSYQLHVHLLAAGDVLIIIERLRSLPVYRPPNPLDKDIIKRPILGQKSRDLLRQRSYNLCQSFWPAKPIFRRGKKWCRSRRRQRIPDRRLAQLLVWFDSYPDRSFTLLHGCKLQRGYLKRVRN